MATLNVGGRRITVDDSFLNLSPEEQNATVEEITSSFGAPPKAAAPTERSWKDVPLEALSNTPHSAYEFGKNIVQPFIHPIDTAVAIKNLGKGVLQKTGVMSGDDATPYADAVGQFLTDRYGSVEGVKKTLATDPVGLAADLSMLLTGGGTAAARAPGLLGKVGEITATTGRAVDPLLAAGKAAGGVGFLGKGAYNLGTEAVGAFGTHTGGEALRTAGRAGYEGGPAAAAFQEHLRGTAPLEEVVTDARGALSNIRREKNTDYQAGKAAFSENTSPLNFGKVDDALADITQVKTFHGKIVDPSTQAIRKEIGQVVQDWKTSDPALFHTAEGFDALKQRIGDIRDKTQYGTPERYVADHAYQAVRKTITKESPEYAKTMKAYGDASAQIKEIEKGLSLKNNASVDTSLRNLQSVLRNNVNTNYGYRQKLADVLVDNGATNLMEKLAGQSLNPYTPRGLGKLAGSVGAQLAAVYGGGPAAAALLPLMSPRIMGESLYYGGRGAKALSHVPVGKARPAMLPAYQAGRLADDEQPDWRITGKPKPLQSLLDLPPSNRSLLYRDR